MQKWQNKKVYPYILDLIGNLFAEVVSENSISEKFGIKSQKYLKMAIPFCRCKDIIYIVDQNNAEINFTPIDENDIMFLFFFLVFFCGFGSYLLSYLLAKATSLQKAFMIIIN